MINGMDEIIERHLENNLNYLGPRYKKPCVNVKKLRRRALLGVMYKENPKRFALMAHKIFGHGRKIRIIF